MSDANNCFTPHILKPLIGDSFRVVGAEADTVNLELIEIEEDVIKGFDGLSFIASFKGDVSRLPAEGIYQIEHDSIGRCELMLPPSSENICDVVISRMR